MAIFRMWIRVLGLDCGQHHFPSCSPGVTVLQGSECCLMDTSALSSPGEEQKEVEERNKLSEMSCFGPEVPCCPCLYLSISEQC